MIFSGSPDPKDEPLIIVQSPGEGDDTDEAHVLVLWRLSVLLSRPGRVRLQNPSVVFSAAANLKPAEQVEANVVDNEYLPSLVPDGYNMFEAFARDPALKGVKPRLSTLRVSRVIPASRVVQDLLRPLKNISKRGLRIYPAFSVRVRYAKPNSTPSKPSVIASVDIDITPYAGQAIILEKVGFTVNGGIIEDLNHVQGMTFPISCLPEDDITLLYRVTPSPHEPITTSTINPVSISVTARVLLSPTSQSHISANWQTSIDFTPPLNPGFGLPSQPLQRDHRPAQLSVNSIDSVQMPTTTTLAPLAASRPDALPSIEITTRHQRSLSSVPDFGITMTFSHLSPPPPGKFYAGSPFYWQVLILNRSDRARKLALIPIPRRRRPTGDRDRIVTNRPPSTAGAGKEKGVADAVMDENVLCAMQRHASVEGADVVCLSTDIRVGPLQPGSCHVVELGFVPLRAGVLEVECVRVVNLGGRAGEQEFVDVRDLPTVVVAEAEG